MARVGKLVGLPAVAIVLLLVFALLGGGIGQADPPTAAEVQAQAAQGRAAPGNASPARLLVIVTEPRTGAPVTGLTRSDFIFVWHGFDGPPEPVLCAFRIDVVSFFDIGTGAYQLQLGISPPPCVWVAGDYLFQVWVHSLMANGQAAVTLHVRSTS